MPGEIVTLPDLYREGRKFIYQFPFDYSEDDRIRALTSPGFDKAIKCSNNHKGQTIPVRCFCTDCKHTTACPLTVKVDKLLRRVIVRGLCLMD